ncbi:MAG: hypothetical protein JW829_18915 [Pirellulales bacterium]|nr:hypothetical protein [Pirellulales bacterium]
MRLFIQGRRFWLIPTVVGGVLGIAVAIGMPRYWEASQALIVRETAMGGQSHQPGRFASLSEMKTLQETVLELAKSKSVVEATLKEVGPPSNWRSGKAWPTERAIDDFRGQIRMLPPGGAEFGMTEVFYLAVRAESRKRALQLVNCIHKHLDAQFRNLRDNRAQSMIDELEDACFVAETNLASATEELAAFEAEVGADLTELRMLQTSPSAYSDLRLRLLSTEDAKRLHETSQHQDEELLELLHAVREDPDALIATPDILLSSQPALRRLKEGLIDAQLVTAGLLGTRSANHPSVLASQEAEAEIRHHLREEIETAIQGVGVSLQLNTDRVAAMEQQLREGQSRLERLAQLRANYSNLIALNENRTKLAEAARNDLADAQAAKTSARAASLIQRIDGPETGVNPVGPGRAVVAGTGLIGGFVFGMGLLFLFPELSSAMPQQHLDRSATREPFDGPPKWPHAETPTGQGKPFLDDVPDNEIVSQMDCTVTTTRQQDLAEFPTADMGTFGLFHGMSLHEACQQVATRDQLEVSEK